MKATHGKREDIPTRRRLLASLRRAGGAGLAGLSALLALPFATLVATAGEGLSLSPLSPAIATAIAERARGAEVTLDDVVLRRGDRGAALPLRLDLAGLTIDQGQGSVLRLPSLSMKLAPAALLAGRPAPTYVEIRGASLVVTRAREGLRFGGTLDLALLSRLSEVLALDGEGPFEGAVLEDFDFAYEDPDAGTRFSVEDAQARVTAEGRVYTASLNVPFATENGGSIDLAARADLGAGEVDATLSLIEAPAANLLQIFVGEGEAFQFDAPVSGTVSAAGSVAGGLGDVLFDLRLDEGRMGVVGADIPVRSLALKARHDILGRTLTIDRMAFAAAGVEGALSGEVAYLTRGGAIDRITFEAKTEEVMVPAGSVWQAPLDFGASRLEGEVTLAEKRLDLAAFDVGLFDTRLIGDGRLLFGTGARPDFRAAFRAEGALSPEEVIAGWPLAAARPAREWVAANLMDGQVSDLTGTVLIPPDAWRPSEFFERGDLTLDFVLNGITARFAPTMSPATDVVGTGRIAGNGASFAIDRARVRDVRVMDARVEIDRLVPKGAPLRVEAALEGPLATVLAVLDEAPGEIVSTTGFSSSAFSGTVTATMSIVRPLLEVVPLTDYTFEAEGAYAGLALDSIGPGLSLEEGAGTFSLADQRLTVDGRVVASDIPASFRWEQDLFGSREQHVTADTRLDARALSALGLPVRRFMKGQVDLRIDADGRDGAFRAFDVKADLSPAQLFLADGRLLKPAGAPGNAAASLVLGASAGEVAIENMRLSMPSANVEGNARFTTGGALVDLDLPRFFVEGLADVSIRLRRDDRRLSVGVLGEHLDAAPLIDRALRSGAGGAALPGAVDLDVSLTRLGLKGGAAMEDFAVRGHYDGTEMALLEATGDFAGEPDGAFALSVTRNPQGLGKDIFVQTNAFGSFVRGLFGITSVLGGQASLTGTLLEDGPAAGTVWAENIVLRDTPTIAQLLSIGSLDGLAGVLNGEGLSFSTLSGDVQLAGGELRLVDARLTGSSLGLSANGAVHLEENRLDLHGAVAPAYGVNSAIGMLPGLGDLFVSRDGEGVIAFSYRVTGPMENATVSVNTLSALAPGIFRRIFEPVLPSRPSTKELLAAAEDASGDAAARDFLSTPELLREYEQRRAARLQRPALTNER